MRMLKTMLLCASAVALLGIAVSAVTVTDVYNSPNPLVTQTTFYLVYYPTPYSFNTVAIKIYNLSGTLVAQPNAQGADHVHWNGTDFNGNNLANGTYIYKAYVYELRYGVPYLFWSSTNKTLQISR